jgi:hypothetical protein
MQNWRFVLRVACFRVSRYGTLYFMWVVVQNGASVRVWWGWSTRNLYEEKYNNFLSKKGIYLELSYVFNFMFCSSGAKR